MANDNGKTLSILIPAYNEQATIGLLLEKVAQLSLPADIARELVVVNDASTDGTAAVVRQFQAAHPGVPLKYLEHPRNRGKGAAVRTAIDAATGDILVIQDADLEYDPNDFNLMLPHILSGECQVVYGSRFLNKRNRHSYQSFYLGGRFLSLCANLLYRQHLTDEPTCYKMFTAPLLKSMKLDCTGFEFCPEVTAKAARAGHRIKEVAINYYPRSIKEGKKIKWHDGIRAIWTLIRYRFHKPSVSRTGHPS